MNFEVGVKGVSVCYSIGHGCRGKLFNFKIFFEHVLVTQVDATLECVEFEGGFVADISVADFFGDAFNVVRF